MEVVRMAQTFSPAQATCDVGGVLLERPFKVRRLGHFGFNCIRMEDCVRFYTELLGFRISDAPLITRPGTDLAAIAPFGERRTFFTRHGTDHHSLVLANKRVRESEKHRKIVPGVTINQISWQVGGLEEVVNAHHWLEARETAMDRRGRDMPGSNWHTYFHDPDGHKNELYYGMEQIGWDWHSKPVEMHDREFHQIPELPQISEQTEIARAVESGTDIHSGSAVPDPLPPEYDVDGVLLPRPFKIVRVGPLNLFVDDVDAAVRFYRETLGLTVTEKVVWNGHRCAYLRANTEHHTIALFPVALRAELGLREDTSCMAAGLQIATYRQLRDTRAFLIEHGVTILDTIPPELHPGIDYALHVLDPDGHCLQLYFSMEQIGWDGRPRPAELRPHIRSDAWPETVAASSDAYAGEVLLGPLG
jgi:catechol 2,3-dioxygenase-like lactoylglutathione lyase family enzyme